MPVHAIVTDHAAIVPSLHRYETSQQNVENAEIEEWQEVYDERRQLNGIRLAAVGPGRGLLTDRLTEYCTTNSWKECGNCGRLFEMQARRRDMSTGGQRRGRQPPVPRSCMWCSNTVQANAVYVYPRYANIPLCFRQGLAYRDILKLRAYEMMMPHMSRQGSDTMSYSTFKGRLRIKASRTSVEHRIGQIEDEETREKVESCYEWLMEHNEYYRAAVTSWTPTSWKEEISITTVGLESVLFPHLYPYPNYCESVQKSEPNVPGTFSMKRSFMSKAHSADIVDYRVNKQLIVFQYQRYLFATVTGAVSSAGPMMNAGSALNNKAFSPYYWMKQLYKLQDVVRQIGLPTLFTTFTINERSFPWPNWFVRDMELQDNLPVDNGMGVTLHGHHIIEQLLKGLFAGNVREGRGNPTVLRNARSGEESLKCFFYKVEFQQRGTLHVHALFWSKDVEHSQLFEKSREDFPLNDPFLCALVRTIEVRTLQVDETRRYSPALLRVLRSHHDLQFGTPRDLLLSYITHYVSKAADALDLNKRLSAEGAHKAVVGFLNKLVIGIPEMVHTLSDNKSAYFSGLGKDLKYFPPGEKRGNEVEVRLYRERPAEDGGSNFLQFWRKHTIKNINGIPVAQRYANADNQIVAVGINPPRLNNELWWEYLVFTELPHRADDDLRCADFETLPESVRYFACAYELYPGFKDVSTYIGLLTRLGQTNSMIHSMRMRYHSKVALLKYCRMDPSRIEQLIASDRENLPSLRGDQRRVYWEAAKRIKYWCINNEDVLGENNGANFEAPIVDEEEVEEVDRMRPLVMTGPPGTKTDALSD